VKVEQVDIGSLKPDPANARKHSKRNLDAIAESLRQFGQQRAAVIRSDGTVLAGNGMLDAARALGWTQVAVTVVPDEWTDDQARAYALADNRTAELAEWDGSILDDHLQTLIAAGWDVGDLGFDPIVPPAVDADDDTPVEVPPEPVTVTGDLWQIGPHRIICGDSSDPLVLDRLLNGVKVGCVLTDPPYGINLDTDYTKMPMKRVKSNSYRRVANDDVAFDASFLSAYFSGVAEQFWFGANYYRRTLSESDLDGSWLVWDKRNDASDAGLGSGFELCWSKTAHKQDLLRYLWTGFTARERDERRSHPTQKPIALCSEVLERWSPKGCAVADPFAGSGTTLIAAAKTGRFGYGVEMDAGYVDVIVARLEAETGETATRVS